MQVKDIIDLDFVNYKKPSMFIATTKCNFKCDKECGEQVCQNSPLIASPNIEIDEIEIAKRFYKNPITESIVIGGLEPFDTFTDLIYLVSAFRMVGIANDQKLPTIIIYTGYYPNEIMTELQYLYKHYQDIIIKFGRFVPNQKSHYDELLGVELASENQFSMKLEDVLNDRFNHIR